MSHRRMVLSTCALVMMLCATGCASKSTKVVPVAVPVSIDGQPVVGATVVLHPVDDGDLAAVKPMGTIGDDGIVRFSTFAQNDGVPPGEYVLTLSLFQTERTTDEGRSIKGGDRFKGRYSDPSNPAAPRINVKKGVKLSPIDL